jgi:multisubunit Na+/H+ antiporter MnhB subunit
VLTKEWLKKLIFILMLTGMLGIFSLAYFDIINFRTDGSKDYYLKNTYEQTGSRNFVTGIYLDYRLFDSLFEAGILLITATGIVFMFQKDPKH